MARRDPVILSKIEYVELSHWACAVHGDGRVGRRARIVLLAADGVSNDEISRRIQGSRQTVVTWLKRFRRRRMEGLLDAPRSGRPRTVDAARVLAWTLEPPPQSLRINQWSSRTLASTLGISNAQVNKIWQQWNIVPKQCAYFTFGTNPALRPTSRYPVGVYVGPRIRAVVLCAQPSEHATSEPGSAPDTAPESANAQTARQHVQRAVDSIEEVSSRIRDTAQHIGCAGLPTFLEEMQWRGGEWRPVHVVLDRNEHPERHWDIDQSDMPDVQLHYATTTAQWVQLLRVFLWVAELRRERFGDHNLLAEIGEEIVVASPGTAEAIIRMEPPTGACPTSFLTAPGSTDK